MSTMQIAGLDIVSVNEASSTINLLIYGEAGVGKTLLAGSASVVDAMSPVLLIDIEGGTMSLRDFYPAVHVVRVTTWRDLQRLYDAVRKGEGGYKTVIIDSLSEAQRFSMSEIMRGALKEDPTIDPDIPRMRDWGKNIEQIRRLVRGWRDLPINVIFTALADIGRNKAGKTTARPLLSGKLAGEVPGFMDIVLYMYINSRGDGDKPKRLLLSTATDTELAKDRSNRLPTVIEEPTMQFIYNRITQAEGV